MAVVEVVGGGLTQAGGRGLLLSGVSVHGSACPVSFGKLFDGPCLLVSEGDG